jgi:hypothetical protein
VEGACFTLNPALEKGFRHMVEGGSSIVNLLNEAIKTQGLPMSRKIRKEIF